MINIKDTSTSNIPGYNDIFSLNGQKIKLGERDNCFIGLGYLLGIGIHPDGLGEKIKLS